MRGALLLAAAVALVGCGDKRKTITISAENMTEAQRQAAPDGKPLIDAVLAYLGPGERLRETATFSANVADLNGDLEPEALVYLRDGERCGSGGCSLFVLRRNGDEWEVSDRIRSARLPVYRLRSGPDSWSELGITVGGEGADRAVMAVPHDAGGYADNPTISPARPVDPKGYEVLLSDEAPAAG